MQLNFQSSGGSIECDLQLPEGAGPFLGVVLCHPHPLMGGNMYNNVISAVAIQLRSLQIATLRFNFRGVGNSEGYYNDGIGEIDDAVKAVRFLANYDHIQKDNVGLVGYSFGAGIALKAALQDDTTKALSIIGRGRIDEDLNVRPDLPIQFVTGDQDKIIPQEDLSKFESTRTASIKMEIIPGADHFFVGLEQDAGHVVANFFQDHFGLQTPQ